MIKTLKKIIFPVIIASCQFASAVHAGGPGTTGGIMLTNTVSARAMGMGDAFTAVSDDVNAIYWNPAGLCNLNKTELNAMYYDGLMDTVYTNFSYAKPIKVWGSAFGAGIAIFDGGDLIVNSPTGFTSSVKAQFDYMATVAYSKKILVRWMKKNARDWKCSAGAGLKMFSSTLAEQYTSGATALDLGLLMQNKSGLNAALAVQNIGSNIVYVQDEYPLPQTLRLGTSYRFGNVLNSYLGSAEVIQTTDTGMKIHAGLEYIYAKLIAVGYKSGYDLDALTWGLGFQAKGYQIDYAVGDMGKLGNTQKIAYTMRF